MLSKFKFKLFPGSVDITDLEYEDGMDNMLRVAGQALCPLCDKPYDYHLKISYKGEVIPTFHIDCTGRHVKT